MKQWFLQILIWLGFRPEAQPIEAPETEQRQPLMRVLIERHPNPQCTTYHLDRRLVERRFGVDFAYDDGVVRPSTLFSSQDENLSVEPIIQSMVERIYAVSGVSSDGVSSNGVSVRDYSIRVGKARAFADLEVEQGVIAALAESFDLHIEDIKITIESQRHLHPQMLMQDALVSEEA